MSACTPFSAAPPKMPEWRSRSPVRRRDVEVDETARAEVERGHVLSRHAAVEDDAGVRTALVGLEEVDDRMAARLLLAVEGDAHVDRQRALARRAARRPSAAGTSCPCRRPSRARRGSRRESRARTDPTPRGRAAPAAGRRSARRGGPSARRRFRSTRGSRRRRAGASPSRTSSASPPAARTKSHTHSPARRTSSACAGSALTLGIRRSSESSSSQACSGWAFTASYAID